MTVNGKIYYRDLCLYMTIFCTGHVQRAVLTKNGIYMYIFKTVSLHGENAIYN